MKRIYLGATLMILLLLAAIARAPQPAHQAVMRGPVEVSAPIRTPLQLRMMDAESMFWRGSYDSARTAWSSLLLDVASDSAATANVRTWLCLSLNRLGEYGGARAQCEQAVRIERALHLDAAMPRTLNGLGRIAWSQGNLDEAVGIFREGQRVAQQVADTSYVGKIAGNLGLVQFDLAHFDSARVGLETMRRIAHLTSDARAEGNALTNLAMMDIRLGDVDSAISRLQSARALFRQNDYETGEQNALGQLATAYAANGQFRSAFALLDSATAIAAREDLKQEVASNYEVFGDLYRDAGDMRKALDYYRRSQQLNEQLGLQLERGTVLRKIAQLQQDLGIRRDAIASAGAAAVAHHDAGARFEELRDLVFLAEHGQSSELERAAAIARSLAMPAAHAMIALAAARNENEPARVLRILAADSAQIARAGFSSEVQAAQLRATALAKLGRTTDAIAILNQAVTRLQLVASSMPSAMLGASFAAQQSSVYADLIADELRVNDVVAAADATAQVRAQQHSQIDDLHDMRTRALLARIDKLNESLADHSAADDPQNASLNDALDAARAEYENLVARMSWLKSANETSGTRAVQSALKGDEALLSYFMSGDGVFAFVMTPTALSGRKLDIRAGQTNARLRVAMTELKSGGSKAALSALYNGLVAPLQADLAGVHHLIISANGALSYLPFAALVMPDGHFMVERYTTQYMPAPGFLVSLRERRAENVAPPVIALAPFTRELPATIDESRAVRKSWGGKRLLDGRANRGAFMNALQSDAIVHVSSHAAIDPERPLFSYVAVNAGERTDRFEVHDVFATHVRAPLVYLSGCETALGMAAFSGVDSGDDVATFNRAFLSAGARGVVATLWRIEDQSAAVMAASFYRYLDGHDAATALAYAQRAMLRSSRFQQPFFWAAYTFSGDVSLKRGQS